MRISIGHKHVFATGFLYGQLFINLRGRDPEGIVAPNDYEPLRSKLIHELAALVNPATGKPHYARVYRREEIYSGQFLDSMPDLLCVPRDLRVADSGMGFRSNRLFDTDSAISGTHREVGIFAMRSPGVRRGVAIPEIRIYDIAPTILHCLDLPIPDDMDGQVITSAFEERTRRPAAAVHPASQSFPG
jgi:predicted AlkP superfamily phosphohydrolase/phosphomutase